MTLDSWLYFSFPFQYRVSMFPWEISVQQRGSQSWHSQDALFEPYMLCSQTLNFCQHISFRIQDFNFPLSPSCSRVVSSPLLIPSIFVFKPESAIQDHHSEPGQATLYGVWYCNNSAKSLLGLQNWVLCSNFLKKVRCKKEPLSEINTALIFSFLPAFI